MFKLTIVLAVIAYANAGLIAPIVPLAHPVVHHPVALSHSSSVIHHPVPIVAHAPLVHAPLVHAPVVHAAPLIHPRVVPIVRHAPLIAVHH